MRDHFNVPDRYFKSHSIGCLPKQTPERLNQHFFKNWAHRGDGSWPSWMDLVDEYREKLGTYLGVDGAQICPQTNVSSALTKILYSLEKPGGKKTILCSEEDFPTIGFVFKQAERLGYSIRFLSGDPCDPNAWANALDDTVGWVHITHAFSNTSRLTPIQEVAQLANEAGATSIVDIAQSAGVVPISLEEWGVDFAIGTGIKFLCCGPGACFLYASPEMCEQAEPIDVGWFSHENPFEMDIHSFRYAASAMRFFGGTPSPAPLINAISALDLWGSIGPERVYQHIQDHLVRLASFVPESALVSPSSKEHRGGTLVIAPDNRDALRSALERGAFAFDERRHGFRLSVHAYTPNEDIESLIETLRDAL